MADDIVDPDNGENIAQKITKQSVTSTTATECDVAFPENGWTTTLTALLDVTVGTLYRHFHRSESAVVNSVGANSSSGKALAFSRGVDKGYKFFKDGHVRKIELCDGTGCQFVRASVLPSMKKGITYTVKLALVAQGEACDVKFAVCQCPAGLAGNCNHVGGLLYTMEDFVRSGLRDTSSSTCTEKLQKWNQPRCARVQPSRLRDVRHHKQEYGKEKRIYSPCRYDPHPTNLQMQDAVEVAELVEDLKAVHALESATDATGKVEKYGSSCWLRILQEMEECGSDFPGESSSGSEDDDVKESSGEIPMSTLVVLRFFYSWKMRHFDAQETKDVPEKILCSRL